MVDFRQNKTGRATPPNYLARREQRRLLLLVALLGLVVFLMSQVADPARWAWMWAGGEQTPQAPPEQPVPADYDTRVRPDDPEQLPLGTFLARPDEPPEPGPQGAYFPGVKPELLEEVRDHAVLRGAENEAWFHLLDVLQESEQSALEKASLGRVGFIQLYEQPSIYRGKLVTVRGVAKRSFDLQAPQNEYGIESYYQLWLQPEGGPASPIVIYALDLPEDFPSSRIAGSTGVRNIHAPIEVTGFFFKDWAYSTGEAILSAPLVVAKTIDWEKPVEVAQEPVRQTTVWILVAVGAAIGLAAAGMIYLSSRQAPSAKIGTLAARYQAESLDRLQDEDLGPDVAESLRALEAEQSAPPALSEPPTPPDEHEHP